MPCTIPYIPERLHTNERPDIPGFSLGEQLYRRCKEEEKSNPFDTINLIDVSVNRQGPNGNPLSQPDDVLLNDTPENGKGEVYNLTICYMTIMELDENNQYHKVNYQVTVKNENEETDSCTIFLKHKKLDCNYAHCAFEIFYNDVEMTQLNYKKTLKKNTKLKTWCKNELSKMILKEEVRINWNDEQHREEIGTPAE